MTPEEFKSWLLEKPVNAYVGKTRTCSQCPLATFIGEQVGKRVWVSSEELEVYDSERIEFDVTPTPQWMQRFISTLDKNVYLVNVTARIALEVLQEAENSL